MSARFWESARPRVRIGPIVIATTVAAGAMWLFTFGAFESPVRLSAPGGYPLPEFRLPVLNAGLFDADTTFLGTEDLRGNVALVTFWATWCGPCIAEQPSLLALQDEFRDDGLRVVGVLHRDAPRTAHTWLMENGRGDLSSMVGSPEFVSASRGGGLPTTLLVDRLGEVREVFFGYWPEREPFLRERVRKLLDE